MKGRHPEEAVKYFTKLSDREYAIFEVGIALGSIAHQLSGLPVRADKRMLEDLSRALEESFRSQPFRSSVRIKIELEKLGKRVSSRYGYGVITPECLDVLVEVRYGESRAVGRMRYIEELGYPLMFIESVE